MDQRYFPGTEPRSPLASALGEVLQYPTADLPTREDFDAWLEDQLRQDPEALIQPIGPQESREARQERVAPEIGQNVLDFLTQAAALVGILKTPKRSPGKNTDPFDTSPTNPDHLDLMGKRRGEETFGKDVMDTSRRAQRGKWWDRTQGEPYEVDTGLRQSEAPEAWQALREGRASSRQAGWENLPPRRLPPEGMESVETRFAARQHPRPADVVERLDENIYKVGNSVDLPGGAKAHYTVIPSEGPLPGFRVDLTYVTGGPEPSWRRFAAGEYASVGEALAKARQFANRLDLAAKDLAAKGLYDVHNDWRALGLSPDERSLRLPWEPGRRAPYPKHREEGRTYETFPGRWRTDYPFGPGGPE